MADDWEEDATRRSKSALISTTVPSAARVADFLYGGQSNFEADRRAARAILAVNPGVAGLPHAGRAFQKRALQFLVTEVGIRQLLDIGAGLPILGATHEVAQSLAAESRIVYVDNDPMVLSHARALMRSAPGGAVGYVDADVRDSVSIVTGARATFDFTLPVAVLLLFTLAYVTDDTEAAAVVSSLAAAVPSGSYVALYQLASDLDPGLDEAARQWNRLMPTQPITLRSRAQTERLAAGLEAVSPGLVPMAEWRPDADGPGSPVPVYAVVARKL